MIPLLDRYQLVVPASLGDALDDLAQHHGARPFAGGTDLMVLLEAGHLPEGRYVSLQRCRELAGIQAADGGVSIGALTTYTQIQRSALLARDYPLLAAAARETGGVATQNRGTIGGNIANGSPAADTPPVLLVYDAELELLSASGTRRVPYAAFHRGYKQMDLAAGEVIARVILPPRAQGAGYYRKVGTRRAQAISKVCFAGTIRVDAGVVQDVRIAVGSVAPTVIRCARAEFVLGEGATVDQAKEALLEDIQPIDDLRSTADYRRRVAANLLEQFWRDTDARRRAPHG